MVSLAKAVPRRAERERVRHIPGEPGTWIFILGDMTVFALLFGVYVYYRSKDPGVFNRSQAHLHVAFGAINTLLLLTSSLLVVTGIRALRHRVSKLAPYMFAGAFVCGLGFAFNKY